MAEANSVDASVSVLAGYLEREQLAQDVPFGLVRDCVVQHEPQRVVLPHRVRHQAHHHRRAFLHNPPLRYEFSSLRKGSGQCCANGVVGCLSRIVTLCPST